VEVSENISSPNSHLYHYFADKEALIRAMIALQTDQMLQAQ
jgi:AcrR family transcriptional regulator